MEFNILQAWKRLIKPLQFVEKSFSDGTKKIAFPDGSLRYIFPNGMQETFFPDGSIEKIDFEGNTILEHEDGTKELLYNFNNNKNK